MNIRISLLALLLGMSCASHAQDDNAIYNQATEAYNLGQFEMVDSLLTDDTVQLLKGDHRINAYRILALSSLYQDRLEDAEIYASRLLAIDPFYSAYGEAPRFIDLLERLKKGQTTITTASRMAETVEEVPVPMTLITEEMIRASGARTLSEVLLLYVPGWSTISSIEEDVAMRGVYGMSQETVLVMLDGHRLNSQSTNAQAFDYRIGLGKVKQIEVLRGPASSLYGNVALTAVVNIITKSGAEVDGSYVMGRVGSHHSYGGTYVFGKGNLRSDILAWGTVFTSKGERHTLGNTVHYVGGYNSKPAYDLGAKLRWGEMNIEVFGQHAKTVPFYNLIEVGNNFSYDQYAQQKGEKPGMSRSNLRVNLDYDHSWDKFSLSLSGFANKEDLQLYNVLGDTVNDFISGALLQALGAASLMEPHTRGVWQSIDWQTYSFGGAASGTFNYKLPFGMHGSAIAGMQYECFTLTDAAFKLGSEFDRINYSSNRIFYTGTEHTLSAFLQMKHNFTSRIIFNGGLRYDHKIRHDRRHLNTLSPRISLVWLPSSVISVKGAFSHSFVDAPFFYRASQISVFSGGSGLNPEKMDSYQIGVNFNWKPLHLKYDLNLFYNKVQDLVYYNTGSDEETLNKETFTNAGAINMGGVESVLQYMDDWTLANLNFTYQYPFKVENFSSTRHNISNVPKFLLNLTLAQKCYQQARIGKFWARANMHLQSPVECLDNDLLKKLQSTDLLVTTRQPTYAIVGAGVEWQSTFGLSASIDTYNLFDTQYKIGGQLQAGVPGPGFALMGKVEYRF